MYGSKMKKALMIAVSALMVGGCSPKMGKDIVIEPQGNLRFENTKTEVLLGVLSVMGMNVDKEPLRLGTDLKIINRWHSDLTLKALSYRLNEGKTILAEGNSPLKNDFRIASNMQRTLPLLVSVDPKVLHTDRMLGIIQGKRKVMIEGDALIEVWGVEHQYHFSKDATPMIQKALRH